MLGKGGDIGEDPSWLGNDYDNSLAGNKCRRWGGIGSPVLFSIPLEHSGVLITLAVLYQKLRNRRVSIECAKNSEGKLNLRKAKKLFCASW